MRSEGGRDDFSSGFLFVFLFGISYVISLVRFSSLRDGPGRRAGEATTGRSRTIHRWETVWVSCHSLNRLRVLNKHKKASRCLFSYHATIRPTTFHHHIPSDWSAAICIHTYILILDRKTEGWGLNRGYTFDRLTAFKSGMEEWHVRQGRIRAVTSVPPTAPQQHSGLHG